MSTRRFKVGDIVQRKSWMKLPGEVVKVFDGGDVKVKWNPKRVIWASRAGTTTYEEHQWLELDPGEKTIITIEVEGGVVQCVRDLPDGWDYEVVDNDDQQRYYSD